MSMTTMRIRDEITGQTMPLGAWLKGRMPYMSYVQVATMLKHGSVKGFSVVCCDTTENVLGQCRKHWPIWFIQRISFHEMMYESMTKDTHDQYLQTGISV